MNKKKSYTHPFLTFLKFSQGSLLSAVIDFIVFIAAYHVFMSILVAIVLGRLVSSTFNYFYNHKIAFKADKKNKSSLAKYSLLVITVLLLAYLGILFMHQVLHVNIYASKIIIEFLLYFSNFFIQKHLIFN